MSAEPAVPTVSWGDRVATATLMRVAEPGLVGLVPHVRRVGVAQTLDDIRHGVPIANVDVEGMRHRLRTASGEADLAAAADVGARLLCPADPDWPPLLDDLQFVTRDCFGLWVRGDGSLADLAARSVAIVGTRTATDYGEQVAADFAADLAGLGWTVVSGLAYGIDAAAHRGALVGAGPTIGVLACGVDKPYPKGNLGLYEQISASGLVISEHPPGAAPQRPRFLVRNRIIAGLSLGTVVVEMAPRSGAMSTATHAAHLNRHVMCVPGPVTSQMSVGCHQLLRERPETVLVTRASEIVEQCGHLGELAEVPRDPAQTRDLLGPAVARVLEGVPVYKPATEDSIARSIGVSIPVVTASLAALVEAGLVTRTDAGWKMSSAGQADRRHKRGTEADELPFDWW